LKSQELLSIEAKYSSAREEWTNRKESIIEEKNIPIKELLNKDRLINKWLTGVKIIGGFFEWYGKGRVKDWESKARGDRVRRAVERWRREETRVKARLVKEYKEAKENAREAIERAIRYEERVRNRWALAMLDDKQYTTYEFDRLKKEIKDFDVDLEQRIMRGILEERIGLFNYITVPESLRYGLEKVWEKDKEGKMWGEEVYAYGHRKRKRRKFNEYQIEAFRKIHIFKFEDYEEKPIEEGELIVISDEEEEVEKVETEEEEESEEESSSETEVRTWVKYVLNNDKWKLQPDNQPKISRSPTKNIKVVKDNCIQID
jgi:hypothetical protein